MMKKLLLATAASGLVLSTALAQSPSSPPAGSPPAANQKQDMNQKQGTTPPSAAQKQDAAPPAAAQKDDASKPGAAAQKDDASKPGAAAQKQDASKPGASASADKQVIPSQKPDQLLASKFNGTDVVGTDDKKVGDVSDILFDKDGKVLAYVISVGGFLGIGSKDVAMAPSAFELVPGQEGGADKLKISMSQEQLKEMASFEAYQPPKPTTTGAGGAGGGLGRPSPGGGTSR